MKTKIGLGLVLTLLAVPAIAFGGVQPPEDSDWQDGENVVSTPRDEDSNDVAEEAFLGIFIEKCGSVAPFDFDDSHAVTTAGMFSFSGKVANLAAQQYKLTIKGEFVSAAKVVETVTIKKGKCKKTKQFTLHAF